jgi:transposase InsO family protein
VVHKEGFKPAEFITADGPWHHIQIDCQTQLPRSPEGYTTLLSIVDVFSGFCLLYALASHSAHAVAQKLWNAFSIFGFPSIVQSDNGREFVGQVVRELLTISQIDHRFIAAYNPRADGKVERNFGLVNEIAKKLLQGANHLWPLYVEAVQCYINSHISSLTKSTPFALMFGRDPQLPTAYPCLPQEVPFQASSVEQWLEYQRKILEVIRPSIAKRVLESKVRATDKLNASQRQLPSGSFPDGSTVMIKDPAFLAKHSRIGKRDAYYIGPYTVVRCDRNGNYVLQDTDGKELNRHVPPDQIKPHSADSSNISDIRTVELVMGHRGEHGHFEYLVKWKELPPSESTWVPAHDFMDTQCIADYWSTLDRLAAQNK